VALFLTAYIEGRLAGKNYNRGSVRITLYWGTFV